MLVTYEDHWIGRRGPFVWPARFPDPDLNPCDFCVWGYLKSLVYAFPIETREQLWSRVQQACNEIRNNRGTYERMRRSLNERMHLCLETEGRHVDRLL